MSLTTGSFAILATAVAAIGRYGMLAYAVAQRTPEIARRWASSAAEKDVQTSESQAY